MSAKVHFLQEHKEGVDVSRVCLALGAMDKAYRPSFKVTLMEKISFCQYAGDPAHSSELFF